MTKEIEVLKMALEFVEDHLRHWSGVGRSGREVVAAIKEVLAHTEPWEKFCDSNCVWTDHHPDCKMTDQEPVAWRWGVPKLKNGDFEWRYSLNQTRPDAIPLYTTPPQRTWVGLTDEEIETEFGFIDELLRDCCYRTEAKLKEKNA